MDLPLLLRHPVTKPSPVTASPAFSICRRVSKELVTAGLGDLVVANSSSRIGMPRFVNENGRDDHQSFDYLLVVGRDTEKVESVVKQTNDENAYHGERDAADTASETGAADHHGCNRIQLEIGRASCRERVYHPV